MRYQKLFSALLLLLLAGLAFAATKSFSKNPGSDVAEERTGIVPLILKDASAASQIEMDLGDINPASSRKIALQVAVTNDSRETATLSSIRTDCGRLAANEREMTILPDETRFIPLTLDTGVAPATIQRRALLVFDLGGKRLEANLTIVGFVKPSPVLAASPSRINAQIPRRSNTLRRIIKLSRQDGSKVVAIGASVSPPNPYVDCKLKSDKENVQLLVTFSNPATRKWTGAIVVQTEHALERTIEIPLTVRALRQERALPKIIVVSDREAVAGVMARVLKPAEYGQAEQPSLEAVRFIGDPEVHVHYSGGDCITIQAEMNSRTLRGKLEVKIEGQAEISVIPLVVSHIAGNLAEN